MSKGKGENYSEKSIKKMLLAVGLCLIVGLQSVSAARAAVNYAACNFCGTRIDEGEKLKLMSLEWREDCNEHDNCAIYYAVYKVYTTNSCQTPGCAGYGREVYRGDWSGLVHGADR